VLNLNRDIAGHYPLVDLITRREPAHAGGPARLTGAFIEFARARQGAGPGSEPKLALAISAYAREHPVYAVTREGEVIDLGPPQAIPRRAPAPVVTRSVPVS
jgi:hypothetical protein